jgi:hypothetical protein
VVCQGWKCRDWCKLHHCRNSFKSIDSLDLLVNEKVSCFETVRGSNRLPAKNRYLYLRQARPQTAATLRLSPCLISKFSNRIYLLKSDGKSTRRSKKSLTVSYLRFQCIFCNCSKTLLPLLGTFIQTYQTSSLVTMCKVLGAMLQCWSQCVRYLEPCFNVGHNV